MSNVIELKLPVPPSLNQSYANKKAGGRHKTSAYKRWIAEASMLIALTKPKRIENGCWGCCILLPINHKSDIDNRVKPILDVLVSASVTTDDAWCNEIIVRRRRTSDGLAHIQIWSLSEGGASQ